MYDENEKDKKQNPADPAKESEQKPQESAPDGLPKTQEELDALIEKRLSRERKKLARTGQTQQPTQTAQGATAGAAPEAPTALQQGVPQMAGQPQGASQAAVQPDTGALLAEKDRELLLARAQLGAIHEGILPGAVEDAVYLALRQAEKENGGQADEEDVKDALKEVLKRHPEWKASTQDDGRKSGFKVGVDTMAKDAGKTGAGKPLPHGRVIF